MTDLERLLGHLDWFAGRVRAAERVWSAEKLRIRAELAEGPVLRIRVSRDLEGGGRRWTLFAIDLRELAQARYPRHVLATRLRQMLVGIDLKGAA